MRTETTRTAKKFSVRKEKMPTARWKLYVFFRHLNATTTNRVLAANKYKKKKNPSFTFI